MNKFTAPITILLIFSKRRSPNFIIIFLLVPKEIIALGSFKVVWVFTFPVNFIIAMINVVWVSKKSSDVVLRVPPIMYITYGFAALYFALGAKLMTLECGVRFLTDYLNGDTYFKIHRPDHNLDRCRTQFKLVADMESKWEQMQQIIKNI